MIYNQSIMNIWSARLRFSLQIPKFPTHGERFPRLERTFSFLPNPAGGFLSLQWYVVILIPVVELSIQDQTWVMFANFMLAEYRNEMQNSCSEVIRNHTKRKKKNKLSSFTITLRYELGIMEERPAMKFVDKVHLRKFLATALRKNPLCLLDFKSKVPWKFKIPR